MNKNPHYRPVDILIVEDSPTDLMLAREALEHAKVLNNLHCVEDGEEAMAYLHGRGKYAGMPRPDLILLDLNLPRKSGQEVLAEIKADNSLKSIPVVVLTTSKADQDVVQAYAHHVNCYIAKPVDFDKFIEVIQSIEQFWLTVVTLPSA